MSDTKGHTIQVVNGPAGPSLYLDDYRIAGPKPWGGGTVLHEFAFKDKDLIAAGVTLAATPAPLDQRQHQCTHGHMAAQPILDAAMDVFPEEWVAADSSMAMPVTMRGRDVFALRDALKGADRE